MKRKVVVQYIRFKNSPESILMKLVRGLIAFRALSNHYDYYVDPAVLCVNVIKTN